MSDRKPLSEGYLDVVRDDLNRYECPAWARTHLERLVGHIEWLRDRVTSSPVRESPDLSPIIESIVRSKIRSEGSAGQTSSENPHPLLLCHYCLAEGKRSKVFIDNKALVQAAHAVHKPLLETPWWDEDGKRHDHFQPRPTHYACSNGHHWNVTDIYSCWCGWRSDGAEGKTT